MMYSMTFAIVRLRAIARLMRRSYRNWQKCGFRRHDSVVLAAKYFGFYN